MKANPQLENGYLRLANELQAEFCRTRIPGEARQVLDVILFKTYGFRKKEDAIPLSQFANMTGLARSHVCRALKTLEDMRIVTKKGTGSATIWRLNKDYGEWTPLPKRGVPKKGVPKTVMTSPQNGNEPVPILGHSSNNIPSDTLSSDTHTPARAGDRQRAEELLAAWRSFGLSGIDSDLDLLVPEWGRSQYDPAMLAVCRLYGESFRLTGYINDLLKKRGAPPLDTFRAFPARNFYQMFVAAPSGGKRTWRDYVGMDVWFVFEQADQQTLREFSQSSHAREFPDIFPG